MMETVIFCLLFMVPPVALIVLSIKHRKIGGVISVIGAISLILSSFKLFVVEYIGKYILEQIPTGFPAGLPDKVSPTVSVAEVVQPAVNPDLIWFIASIVVFVVGLVWLAVELIKNRRR